MKVKNRFEIGDRVRMAQTQNLGVVIDLDMITNEGGQEPRAKVHWQCKDPNWYPELKDDWICEGNLVESKTRVFSNPSSPA